MSQDTDVVFSRLQQTMRHKNRIRIGHLSSKQSIGCRFQHPSIPIGVLCCPQQGSVHTMLQGASEALYNCNAQQVDAATIMVQPLDTPSSGAPTLAPTIVISLM